MIIGKVPGVLIFCLVLTVRTVAQIPDSIQTAFDKSTSPAERIPVLKHIGEWYLSKRDTTAIRYFKELILLSDQTQDPLLKCYAYYRMGVCRYHQNDIKGSTSLYFLGLEATGSSLVFDEMRAKLNNAIGWNFSLLGHHQNSLKYLRRAESYAKSSDPQTIGLILNNKGVVYKNLNLYDSALLSFQKSLRWNRQIEDQRQVRFNLNNIGTVLLKLERLKESKIYLTEALSLNGIAHDTLEMVNNLINLSQISVYEDSLKKANVQLTQAMALSKASQGLDQQRRIYFLLTALSEKQEKYKDALMFQKEYYNLTDSLYRKEGAAHVTEVEAKYMNLVKENELREARERVATQQFYLSMILGSLFITFMVIFFLVKAIRSRKMSELRLLKLNEEVKKQSEELLRANKAITEANESLERLVEYRKEVIQNQNRRIDHFSFVNSHEIRGPLATLMGLLGLLYEEKSPEKSRQIMGFLKITSTKLDKIIRRVGQELEKEKERE